MGAGGSTMARALVGGFGLLVFILVAFSGRDTALVMIVVWLVLLGFVRRLLIPFAGWAPDDPLLLVSPAAALTLWFTGRRQAPPPPSGLAGMVGFLLVWSLAQIANPNEASLSVAVQGLLFYFTPLVWFFVGRTLDGRQHDLVLRTVLWVNLVVAGHGLYQSFIGFLPFELTWLSVSGQGASVFLPGFKVRPFSTLVSPQEYGIFLSFATLVIWARLLHAGPRARLVERRVLALALLVTLVALFFQGARGSLIFTMLAITVTLVVRLRSFVALVFIAALVVALTTWVGSQDIQKADTAPVASGPSPASAGAVVNHQLSGLTNPSSSSATLHVEQAIQGFEDALSEPFGRGVSEATIASARNEGPKVTPENDIGNTMVALGLPGGLALVGIVLAGLGQWLNGGLYAVSTILFLTLGGISREIGEHTGEVTP